MDSAGGYPAPFQAKKMSAWFYGIEVGTFGETGTEKMF
jgi:hypothetical protein